MRRIIAPIFLIATAGWHTLYANPIDIYTPETQLKGGASLFYNSGNLERILTRGDVLASHHNPLWAGSTNTSYTWGTFGPLQTEDDWSSRNFAYSWPHARVYPFAMHWLETGLRRRINLRNQLGAGATVALFSSVDSVLKFSVMLSGEATDYRSAAYLPDGSLQSPERPLPRFTPRLYYRQKLVPPLSLTAEVWYQQSIRAANDYRWHVESGLEFRLAKAVALKTMAIWHYESAVPLAVKRYDVLWTAGATAEWSSPTEETKK
ncbi:MAG: DUF481 domain-containing protein [Spirochaetota bacterium]